MFHGQTWNYRKSGEPFLMNWYCYAIYGERSKPIYYVAEQEDVTEIEALAPETKAARQPERPGGLELLLRVGRMEIRAEKIGLKR